MVRKLVRDLSRCPSFEEKTDVWLCVWLSVCVSRVCQDAGLPMTKHRFAAALLRAAQVSQNCLGFVLVLVCTS